MKKYIAAFAALAVVGAAGVLYVNQKMDTDTPEESTSSSSLSYYDLDDDNKDSYSKPVMSNKTEPSSTEESTTQPIKEYTFDAEIDAVSGDSLVLKVDENSDVYKSADKVYVTYNGVKTVDTKGNTVKNDDVGNFKKATVYYDGTVMETYPAQVKASKIVFEGRTDCNVYFRMPGGELIDTVTVPVGAALESADMPNAGAYCDDGYHFEGWLLNEKIVYGVSDIQTSITLTAKIGKD